MRLDSLAPQILILAGLMQIVRFLRWLNWVERRFTMEVFQMRPSKTKPKSGSCLLQVIRASTLFSGQAAGQKSIRFETYAVSCLLIFCLDAFQ